MSSTPAPPIVKLSERALSRLRSGIAVTSLPQAIEELVANSLDADARTITVSVHLAALSFTVADDGTGVRATDFPLLGTRYCSSKTDLPPLPTSEGLLHPQFPSPLPPPHTTTPTPTPTPTPTSISSSSSPPPRWFARPVCPSTHLGRRGEFLASLSDVSVLHIESRARGSFETYHKILSLGAPPLTHLSPHPRAAPGTTLHVRSFLVHQPVRRAQLLSTRPTLLWDALRTSLLRLAAA